ncbi:hypothetical protein FRC02_008672 [Tulasnella sp. 418]|nr:hypothetical protein FRC02_008672 [Tulasnella sp. 418]
MASPSSSPVEDTTPTPGHTYSAIGTPYWSEHHLSTSNSYFPPTSPDPRSTSPHHPTTGTHPRRISTNRFPRSNSATSISRRQPGRSTSVASSSFTSRPSGMDDRRFLQVDEDEDPEQSSPDAEDDNALGPRGRERSLTRESLHDAGGQWDPTNAPHTGDEQEFTEDDPITVKDRQSLINVQHPFGLPIWKPALYKKSRTVTRNAETDLHAQPSAVIDRHFIPGNVVWTVLFGWWLSATFILLSGVLYIIPFGGKPYARLVYGLGWYLFWPFGKYVQGDQSDVEEKQAEEDNGEEVDDGHASDVERGPRARVPSGSGSQASTGTVRGVSPNIERGVLSSLAAPDDADERSRLLVDVNSPPNKGYGSLPMSPPFPAKEITSFEYAKRHWLGIICFWLALITIIAPLMLIVCLICWACVITIPMARLTWALLKHLFTRPTSIQFCPALALEVVPSQSGASATSASGFTGGGSGFTLKSAPRLTAGQTAPSGPGSKVLICTYRAIGLQYYKYTVGGVNVMFIILLPVVFFVIFDGFVLLPYLEYLEHEHKSIPPLLPFLASRSLIFVLSLTSVIPLSYFIGMAVASISAQSSIGMGAVINATFGSIIEIILYAIALTQGKGKLVEGSIVGSLLAGVLLMPGASMVSGAWRKKEQKFNAKSAGVTSTMLIMAIIGTLTPTMFYQTYGNFELICEGCPPGPANPGETWKCSHCYYDHPDPVEDPFYQNTVKKLMYFCAAILLLSYLIGLWFSLRTHATQIWQNPQPLLNPLDLSHIQGPAGTGTGRMSMVNRIVASHLAQAIPQHNNRLARKASTITSASVLLHHSRPVVLRHQR